MSQDESNQNDLILIVNFCDKAVFISADVENSAFLIGVSVRKSQPRISKTAPFHSSGDAMPSVKRFFCVRMLLPKLPQFLLADYMHGEPFPFMLPKRQQAVKSSL
jgi:hypothetical protein